MEETVTLTRVGTVKAMLMFVKPPDNVDYDLKTYITSYSFRSRHTKLKNRGWGFTPDTFSLNMFLRRQFL